MIRVGLVGYGWVNRTVWAPRLRRDPRVEIVGVVDPLRSDPPKPCADLDTLLDRNPALVVIGTPNDTHAAIAFSCLNAGVAVAVEKPACLRAATFDRLADVSRTTDVPLVVSDASVRRADVRQLGESMPGGPKHVDASWVRVAGVPDPGSWFTRREHSGGGALLDLGWHLADVAFELIGSESVLEVTAEVGRRASPLLRAGWRTTPDPTSTHFNSPAEPDVELEGRLAAHFADGSSLTLHAAWAGGRDVDTTRVAVRNASASAVLTTTFGFSPCRVERPTIVRNSALGTVTALPTAAIGAEYDDLVDATLAAATGDSRWHDRLSRASAVQHLMEEAYRAARVALPADGGSGSSVAALVG